MLAFSRLYHKLLLENGTAGRPSSLASFCRPGYGRQVLEAQRSAARDHRLLLLPDPPAAFATRRVLQRQHPGGRSGSQPLRLPERPCTSTSSVTLRSWLRRLPLPLSQQSGGQELLLGGFLPRPPFLLQVVGRQGEKSMLVGRSLHVDQDNDLCVCSHNPFSFGGRGCCSGRVQKDKGFSNYTSCFHHCSSSCGHTHARAHTLINSLP